MLSLLFVLIWSIYYLYLFIYHLIKTKPTYLTQSKSMIWVIYIFYFLKCVCWKSFLTGKKALWCSVGAQLVYFLFFIIRVISKDNTLGKFFCNCRLFSASQLPARTRTMKSGDPERQGRRKRSPLRMCFRQVIY